jgi:hypothetical protein
MGIPHDHLVGFPTAQGPERGQVTVRLVVPGGPGMRPAVGREVRNHRPSACSGTRRTWRGKTQHDQSSHAVWHLPSHGRGRRFDPCIAHHCRACPSVKLTAASRPHRLRSIALPTLPPQMDANVFLAALRCGMSTILPSTPSVPAAGFASKAATIFRACSISASDGA